MVVAFVAWLFYCDQISCTMNRSSSLLLEIGMLNFSLFLMVVVSTCLLVKEWRAHLGADYQR